MKSITLYLRLIRPRQWVKNAFVFAPLVFAMQFDDAHAWTFSALAALAFALVASSIYIMNDIHDVKEDRAHPQKRRRPIASGQVSVARARVLAVVLALAGFVVAALALPRECLALVAGYAVVQMLYTHALKYYAIIDVLIIASGFVMRVLMGGFATNIYVSSWIILTTYMLALFIASGKRYHEYALTQYHHERVSLASYSAPLLDRMIGISCACALLMYALYTVETARATGHDGLVYTTVFVVFGLFRYLQVLYVFKEGGAPESVVLKDKLFLANGIAWLVVTLAIMAR